MSSFTTYIVGFVILVVGLAMAAYLLNVPDGVNLAVNTSITVYAVVLAPLTFLEAGTRVGSRCRLGPNVRLVACAVGDDPGVPDLLNCFFPSP